MAKKREAKAAKPEEKIVQQPGETTRHYLTRVWRSRGVTVIDSEEPGAGVAFIGGVGPPKEG